MKTSLLEIFLISCLALIFVVTLWLHFGEKVEIAMHNFTEQPVVTVEVQN